MRIIHIGALNLIGLVGDGSKTAELWNSFDEQLENAAGNGYEVRFYQGDGCDCFVGVENDHSIHTNFMTLTIPESDYAVFDVLVANGYDSENANIDQWLGTNKEIYRQRELNCKKYVLEVFGNRFSEGIVEICIPIEKIPE